MTILWKGHEADDYVLGHTNNIESSSFIDGATYARAGTKTSVSGVGNLTTSPDWAPVDELWYKFTHGHTNATGAGEANKILWAAMNSAGVTLARLRNTTSVSGVVQPEVWNGSAYVAVGSPFTGTVGDGQPHRYHVRIRGGASGVFEVYMDGTLAFSQAGDFSAVTGIVRCWHQCPRASSATGVISHAIAATTPTLNMICENEPPTSTSTDATGTGGFADVDETVFSDVDFVTFPTTGLRTSFKSGTRALTLPKPLAIVVSGRLFYEAGGASSARPYLKIGGVRYYGTTFALTLLPKGYQYAWETNPATGLAWTIAECNDANLEYGWESV